MEGGVAADDSSPRFPVPLQYPGHNVCVALQATGEEYFCRPGSRSHVSLSATVTVFELLSLISIDSLADNESELIYVFNINFLSQSLL